MTEPLSNRQDRPNEGIFDTIKAQICDLPPQVQERIWQIIIDHADTRDDPEGDLALLYDRVSVRHESRSYGSRYWRLYIESGNRTEESLRRVRRYIGLVGGPELMNAVRTLRQHYFTTIGRSFDLGVCNNHRAMLRRVKHRLRQAR